MSSKPQIKSFNKKNILAINSAVKNMMTRLEDYGLGANVKFTWHEGEMKFTISIAPIHPETGIAETLEVTAFRAIAPQVGIPADLVGQTLMFQGQPIKILGWRPKGRINCITIEKNGKRYRCSAEMVKAAIAETAAINPSVPKRETLKNWQLRL